MKRIIISIFIIHLCVLSFADSFTDVLPKVNLDFFIKANKVV